MSEVSTDVKSIADQVREKLSGTVASILPAEVWDQMIDASVKQLIEPTMYGSKMRPNDKAPDHYNKAVGTPISLLQRMIEDQLFDLTVAEVKQTLGSHEFQEQWNGYGQGPSEAIQKFLVEHKADLMDVVIGRLFGTVTQSILTEVRNMNRF